MRTTCRDQGWPLLEYRPVKRYDEIVMKHGFPGPGAHLFMYRLLKERPVRQLVREHKSSRSDKILLITGVRSQESIRRMGNVQPIQADGSQVWVSLIHDWSKTQVLDYRDLNNLPHNPVVDLYHHSGECLCGAFAREGELDEIALWYPETAARIHALETRAKAAGIERAEWGKRGGKPSPSGVMCSSCAATSR